MLIMAMVVLTVMSGVSEMGASAAAYAVPSFVAEKTYESTANHPYNKQTNTLIVNWKKT